MVQTLAWRSSAKSAGVRDNPTAIYVGDFLSNMSSDDDPEAFLQIFGRTAKRKGWPKKNSGGPLAI